MHPVGPPQGIPRRIAVARRNSEPSPPSPLPVGYLPTWREPCRPVSEHIAAVRQGHGVVLHDMYQHILRALCVSCASALAASGNSRGFDRARDDSTLPDRCLIAIMTYSSVSQRELCLMGKAVAQLSSTIARSNLKGRLGSVLGQTSVC